MIWPGGKRFAFTVFDDPDAQSLQVSELVYGFLNDAGFRTTKAVWPLGPSLEANSGGVTCACEPYRRHALALQSDGFEIAYHLAGPQSSTRQESIQGLERFREIFGTPPTSMANHYNREALYWGHQRLSGWRRSVYQLATVGRNSDRFSGQVEGNPYFWGDLCHSQIRYCRNFVFREINTLRACPQMPYHDPLRPWVNLWFASTEGAKGPAFLSAIGEAAQDVLEEQGGACIMYTHFGHGFVEGGQLKPRFRELMHRLSRKNGWFVPATTLLDHVRQSRSADTVLNPAERSALEWRWLRQKLFHGVS
jgi:hypothetical protein